MKFRDILPSKAVSALALLGLTAMCGCSTVIEGRSQQVTVDSSPPGALCVLKQADEVVARLTTPGTASVGKTKNDLVILCSKDGYESVSVTNRSDLAVTSFGNMVFGQFSFVGNAVDSASGATNKYDARVFVDLVPATEPAAFPPMPGAQPVMQFTTLAAAQMSMQAPMPGAPLTPAPLQPIPQAAAPVTPFTSIGEPALKASVALAKAVRALQPAPLSYAQAAVEAQLRPPFNTTE